ncbi:MAG: hypothetical protein LBH43_07935 [Treponema sp.]|jgi:phage-related protein|nr:hypothetical protein [Treponema sp.]
MTVREFITVLGFKLDDAPVKKYEKQIDSTKEKTNKLATATKGIGVAWKIATAAAAVGVGWLTKNIIAVTAETENYRVALGTMMGDQEKANKIIRDLDYGEGLFEGVRLSDFYGTKNAIGGLQNMVTFGMEAEKAGDVLVRLGDIAQGNSEAFVSLSNAMGQVFARGKADGQKLKQFAAQGFDVVGVISAQTGKTREMIEKEGVSYEQTAAALKALTDEGGKYYGMMSKQMNTITGIAKQFQSLWASIGEAIGQNVMEPLKDTMKEILKIARALQDNIVAAGTKAFEALINAIQDVIIFFQILQMRMKRFGGAFTPLKAIFEDVFGFLGSVIESAYPFLLNLATLILVVFKPIQAFVKPILESLKPVFRSVFGLLSGILEEIIGIVNDLTPHFEGIGKAIGKAFEKIVPLLENIKRAIIAAFMPIKAFLKPIIESLKPLFEKVFGAIGKLFSQAGEDTKGLAGIIEGLTPLFSLLGNIVSVFVDIFGTGLAWIIDILGPFLKYILIIIGAIKAWSIVQGILNVVMSLNPIGAIILAVVALIAVIGLLVKNWDKVSAALKKAFEAIGNFFKKIWEGIKSFFSKVVDFVKKNALNIMNVLLAILFFPAGIIMAVVRLIIKHWDKIKPALLKIFTAVANVFSKIWNGIKNVALAVWEGIKNAAATVFEGIKAVWHGITGFFSGLWDGVKNITASVWEGIKNIFFGVVDSIKNTWFGIIGFFTGLWDAMKKGPAETFEYIKNAFFGLFDSIKEKFLGFINIIKDGWDKVKGFFSGVKDGIVNVVTGGGSGATQTKPVNDLIVTPEGQYSTHPDDYIMAMKNPGDLLEALMRFLGGGQQLQPAYASAAGSLAGDTLSRAAASHTNYNNSNTSNYSYVTPTINVSVNASGMSPEAASAAVKRGVQDALNDAINGSRGAIPSPEARRN